VAYYGHDLHFRRLRLQGEMLGDERLLRTADRMEEREAAIWRSVDAVLYPSEEEAAAVRNMRPGVFAHAVSPWCFDSFGCARAAPPGQDILFVGGFGHPPNEDAACWFVEAVLPLILQRVPDARLAVVGSNPTTRVRELAGDTVCLFADVSEAELAAWYRRARVAVVPLRCGAGVKLKTVEALREGVPLVVSPVGAQGLPGLELIAPMESEPLAFAAAVCDLLREDGLWERRSADQIDYARMWFTRAAMHESLLPAMLPVPPERAALAA
jgi:glycosyltransferase involved in cell wall biosynthesis